MEQCPGAEWMCKYSVLYAAKELLGAEDPPGEALCHVQQWIKTATLKNN